MKGSVPLQTVVWTTLGQVSDEHGRTAPELWRKLTLKQHGTDHLAEGVYTFLDECVLKLLMFVTVSNLCHPVLGSEHVFKLLCAIFGCTVRFEDTFLLLGQGAEYPIKDLWQFIFRSVHKSPHESSFPTYDDGTILSA